MTAPTPPERGRDGLRDDLGALAACWEGEAKALGPSLSEMMLKDAARDLRRILAEHPATGDGDRDEWCREESCEYRRWRSGDMPTHRRGGACPPASDVDSDNAAAGGAEGLAEELRRMDGHWQPYCAVSLLADDILASDWLAAHVAKAKAEAFDAVLAEADEGIEFGPKNMILLHRVVNRAARNIR